MTFDISPEAATYIGVVIGTIIALCLVPFIVWIIVKLFG